MNKAALFSVSDKRGVVELARAFHLAGYTLLSTSGSAKLLVEAGLPVLPIEEYTGQAEILDGRVKTLHPRLYAGILARRDNAVHMAELQKGEISRIDAVVVNLYPFIEARKSNKTKSIEEMVELIDIGGPSLLRAAAKNFSWTLPICDPDDYPAIISALGQLSGDQPLAMQLDQRLPMRLATKVFTHVASYNLAIASYLSAAENQLHLEADQGQQVNELQVGTPITGAVLKLEQELRYGENPHQKAGFYSSVNGAVKPWKQLQGKLLSYNNLLDCDAALAVLHSFSANAPTVCILKHLTPCGAASRATLLDALQAAKQSDPRSHFGGILVFNREVDAACAEAIAEDFAEIALAPKFSEGALSVLAKKKNLRVLEADLAALPTTELRSAAGGYLWQECDLTSAALSAAQVVSDHTPTAEQLRDLQFAWTLVKHVKSNAIVIVRDQMLIGAGGGQTSRIDAVELAIKKAADHNHNLHGSVAASDAFFPFPDSIETLAKAGVAAVMAPKGALRDADSIKISNELGMSLLFSDKRHFRH